MSDNDSGWEALFNPEDDLDSLRVERTGSAVPSAGKLKVYRDLPGVSGAIQVTLDGVIINQDLPGEPEYYAALAATIGSTGRLIDSTLSLGGYEYAVVRLEEDLQHTMIFRSGDTFIGLLLSGEIAPTHIVARLRDLGRGGRG